jgi:hypothetical protein
MEPTLKPRLTIENDTKTETQNAKERKMKSKIITLIWPMLFLLAGVLLIAGAYLGDEVQGLAFFLLVALCFIAVASRSQKNWWAIIPGGIFASLGLAVVVEILIPHEEYPTPPNTITWGVYIWVLFLGLAATFGALWLLRKAQPTDWAKYPAAGLLALAVLALILGSRFQEVWQVTMLLVFGATLMLALFGRKRLPASQRPARLKI